VEGFNPPPMELAEAGGPPPVESWRRRPHRPPRSHGAAFGRPRSRPLTRSRRGPC